MSARLSKFFERLREERVRLGMTQDQIAAAGGVQRRAQANYEAGERVPDAAYLAAVAERQIDVLYVLTGRREASRPVSPDTPQSHGMGLGYAHVHGQIAGDAVLAPPSTGAVRLTTTVDGVGREYQVIEHITEHVCAGLVGGAAPGGGAGAARTQAGPIAFERQYMAAALGRTDDSYLSLTVEGDSMAPALLNGDLIVIDTQVARVNVSGVYVLRFDGDLTIKRVTKRSDGSLVISSDNPQYARGDEAFTRDQATVLQVIGRMVWPRGG